MQSEWAYCSDMNYETQTHSESPEVTTFLTTYNQASEFYSKISIPQPATQSLNLFGQTDI